MTEDQSQRQYWGFVLREAFDRAFDRTRKFWFFGSVLAGIASWAVPGFAPAGPIAIPILTLLLLFGPELIATPYRLQSAALSEVKSSADTLKALQETAENATALQHEPILIPSDGATRADPVVYNERVENNNDLIG